MNTSPHPTPPIVESRWRKFASDIVVYAAGNLGAKVLTFMMVPLYTYFIPDTKQFGYFDICLTAAFLLTPLSTLDLRDGVFRFLLDTPDRATRSAIVTATCRMLSRSLLVTLALLIAAGCCVPVAHQWLALLLVVGVMVNDVYGQMVRGLGQNRVFVGMGVATAALVVLLSVALVGWLRMGVAGIFVANAAARLLPVLVVELWRRPATSLFDRHIHWGPVARELLRFTLPLMPTMLVWWLLSFGDRWFVLWAAGAGANGVYAVAARFTGVIYTFTVIMQQAWQETAILQYGSDDRDNFFSQIFATFIYVTCLIVIAYMALLKLNYGWLVEAHYASSLAYLFPMALAATIYATATFFEMGYQCSRDTRRALPASIVTALVNIVLNLLLAPRWGVWGVIASATATFVVLALWRYHDSRRYFTVRPGWRTVVPVTMMLVVGAAGYAPIAWWVYAAVALAAAAATLWSLPRHLLARIPLAGKLKVGSVSKQK